MKRLLGAVVAILLLSGCRAPAPPNDPFLYRSTVPPPGTIVPSGPMPAQPYYPGAAAPSAIPGPTTAPPLISPGTPITPAPAPLTPSGVPISPTPAPNRYSPPGGFNYQSSLRPPVALPPANSVAITVPAGNSPNSGVISANWQAPKGNRADNVVALAASDASQPRPEPSVVRIVEPSNSVSAAKPVDNQSAAADSAANAPVAPAPTSRAAPADSPMPPTISIVPVNSSTVQTVERPSIPEITDLPPANGTAGGTAAASGAKSTAAGQAPVNIPADRPGTSYGYDPDYKTLRGKLEYSVAGQRWRLIYLPPDGAIDEYGGNATLPDPSQLDGFEAGDFVTAQGAFSPPGASGGSATFAIQRIKRQ
jgi:hypothetical protein